MTFPERSSLERPLEPPASGSENTQDVIPPTERNQDPQRTDITHGLATDSSRPLTDDERKAADGGTAVGERVYAPASERVPREPVPGHRDFVEHPDTHTPERMAAGQAEPEAATEPPFTRVARPSTNSDAAYSSAMTNESPMSTPSESPMPDEPSSRGMWLPMGIGWAVGVGMCAGVGIWLWMRWQRERNKPINRIRRQARQTASQARQTAYELRDRMPSTDEAAVPAVGLSTAVLPILVWAWQRSRSRSAQSELRGRTESEARGRAEKAVRRGQKAARWSDRAARQAMQTVSEMDWQQRLSSLKELWHPGRLELEKTSITRR
jgi:hypothetical protein